MVLESKFQLRLQLHIFFSLRYTYHEIPSDSYACNTQYNKFHSRFFCFVPFEWYYWRNLPPFPSSNLNNFICDLFAVSSWSYQSQSTVYFSCYQSDSVPTGSLLIVSFHFFSSKHFNLSSCGGFEIENRVSFHHKIQIICRKALKCSNRSKRNIKAIGT